MQFFKKMCSCKASKERDIGICGIEVLDNFSCSFSVTLIWKCSIAAFSEPAKCGFC